jgi:hypothetical protein
MKYWTKTKTIRSEAIFFNKKNFNIKEIENFDIISFFLHLW